MVLNAINIADRYQIFCHLYTPSNNVKNLRFFGDSLPDGTPCGYDKFCVDGECLYRLEPCGCLYILGEQQLFSRWSSWGPCSVTCGEGTQRRYRSCYTFYCLGEKEQDRPCYPGQCTAWGGWGYWSSCGYDRTRRRVRQCYGDLRRDICPGSSLELEYC
uniref:Adt-1/2-like domain-containing protein n=1 Tax=Romanomermis culicivorax TaxID=13658 RepID=A0A915JX59_ROMCU